MGLSDPEGDAEKISEAIKTHLNPIPDVKLSVYKQRMGKTFDDTDYESVGLIDENGRKRRIFCKR